MSNQNNSEIVSNDNQLPDFSVLTKAMMGAGFEPLKEFITAEPLFDLTELGNAKRLVCILENHVIWVAASESFYIFKDNRWVKDTSGSVERGTDLLLINIKQELAFYKEILKELKTHQDTYNIEALSKIVTKRIKALDSHYLRSQSKNAIFAVRELFKTRKGITKQLGEFDSKGHYIGCKDVVVDLRKGEATESDKSFLMTKSTSIKYDPTKECPMWLSFLDKIMLGNNEMVDFLQLLAGQMLIGEPCKDKLFILLGDGANGKSVFLDVLTDILGDYAIQSSPDVLTDKSSTKEYYLASLQGKRTTTMVETERGDKLVGAMVKSLVNSGLVTARFAYCRPFTFQPIFTPILATNYLPYINLDPALWRRIIIIGFEHTIPEDERDPGFRGKLVKEEAQGIFNWMVEGAKKLYTQGLKMTYPEQLITALQKYRKDYDTLAEFIVECSSNPLEDREVGQMKCRISELRQVYQRWCQENGYRAMNSRNLRNELEKKGYVIKPGAQGLTYVYGISVEMIDNKLSMSVSGDVIDKELTP